MKKELLLLLTTITKTMCENFEHINVDLETIWKIINKQKVEGIDRIDYRTIYQFNIGIVSTLTTDKKLSFDSILELHKIVGHKLVLEEGEFALRVRKVSSHDGKEITIPVQDQHEKEKEFKELIQNLEKQQDIEIKKDLILNWFIKQIIEQWFMDANKRTAYIVCNKLLFDYCFLKKQNNLLLEFDNKLFNELLANVYLEKYNPEKINTKNNTKKLVDFLKKSILENNKKVVLTKTSLYQLKTFFDFDYNITSQEIKTLTQTENREK